MVKDGSEQTTTPRGALATKLSLKLVTPENLVLYITFFSERESRSWWNFFNTYL